ncbi:glycine--tRNA ligase subunit beta [bacterium LRH843]|nr:glycine--tRNA ligase subunit beta [bacterium LRH843]
MSKRDFLLEVGVEELPARFITGSVNQLRDKMVEWLKTERLAYEDIVSYATPRRLAILIKGLAENQEDIEEEAKGPAKKIAFDSEGNWTKAAQGFARGQGVATDDLYFKELKGVEYMYANKFIAGKRTVDLLPAVKDIIVSLHFPKNMRWGSNELRFARPIQWLVAMYGGDVIPFGIAGIQTGTKTVGHRFLGKEIKIQYPTEYAEKMRKEYVIVDPAERKEKIRRQINELAEENGWIVPIDEGLLEEVHHLVEYPTALFGGFDEEFLTLPKEVLITSMREHQRYFPVESDNGELLPFFVTVRNGNDIHLGNVAKGNEKVLRARLSDAAFFYKEDQNMKIDDALARLEQIVYHEELGSIGDKVRRIITGVAKLGEKLAINQETADTLKRAAQICKFDLVTQMVNEFPELQGRMGEVYAELAGERKEVAQAIHEHYQPRFAGDSSPESLEGTIVSIVDKLDTIVTCFAIGLIPTGSQDPYALRRQAAGIVQMISDHGLTIEVEELIQMSLDVAEKVLKRSRHEVESELIEFFKLRIKAYLQDKKVQYDVIDAVLTDQIGHIPTLVKKAEIISQKRNEASFKHVVEALSRVTNISKKAESVGTINPDLFEKDEEKALYTLYNEVKERVEQLLARGDVAGAYEELAGCEPAINNYFDHIMVMAENEDIRTNRLTQMHAFAKVIHQFADFQAIVFA